MGKGEGKFDVKEILVSSLIFGAAAILVCVVLTGVAAGLVSAGSLAEETASRLIVAAAFVGGAIGGVGAWLSHRGGGAVYPASAAVAAILIRLVISLFLPGGAFGVSDLAVMAAMLVGGLAAGLLGIKRKTRRRR